MIERLAWLGLAAIDPDELAIFYEDTLGLQRVDPPSTPIAPTPEAAFDVGGDYLAIRSLRSIPAGGVHTHFAIAVSSQRYDVLLERLSRMGSVEERRFGSYRSLYWFDPAGHCVEFGERPDVADGVGGVFEVVLEVSDLAEATTRYEPLGFEIVDQGSDRARNRLRGAFDLELWEPQLGIADGRGGAHVELGVYADDPTRDATSIAVGESTLEDVSGWHCVRDRDNHRLCFTGVENA